MGCGSGRWARLVSPKVGHLNCIDPSEAIYVAKRNLSNFDNISFYKNSVEDSVLPLASQDFGYSLGVLHHIPDTKRAIKACVDLLKTDAPLLLYLYYKFDNRPLYYRFIWRLSNLARQIICRLPSKVKNIITDIAAILIYYPMSRLSYIFDKIGVDISNFPLSYYRNHSFYTMRTDARDRLGTPLEKRFTKLEIEKMMRQSGLKSIAFSDSLPYWCVVGIKK